MRDPHEGSARLNRTLTILAAAFLAFDGAALLLAAALLRRPFLAVVGLCLFVSSGLVFVYWRWHRRQLGEIVEARRALSADARAIQDLIRRS